MKPFNLEEAKAGKPVCTRNGKPVRIICFNAQGRFPIIYLVEADLGDDEEPFCAKNTGRRYFYEEDRYDLMMADGEPTYRPFVSKEECWEEMKKHEPFGWVINGGTYICLNEINTSTNFEGNFKVFRFFDNQPFGKKV